MFFICIKTYLSSYANIFPYFCNAKPKHACKKTKKTRDVRKIRIVWTTILILATATGTVRAQSADDECGTTWTGTLNAAGQKLELIFNIPQTEGASGFTLSIPAQGATDIPVEKEYLSADSISLAIPSLGVSYQGTFANADSIKGTFRQMGYPFALNLKRGATAKPNRPQEPTAPLPYDTEEVTFANPKAKGVTLAGTLSYPVGYHKGTRVPVVLMVTGSGQQNRDEELFGHKPFLVLADYLARHGIASLRYDDRGTARSTGKPEGCTTEDFATDAEAGTAYLRSLKRFSRIGVLGHSEGGTIAFMLAARKQCDFIVVMAAPAMRGDTLIASQTNAIMRQKGIKGSATAKQMSDRAKLSGNAWTEWFVNYNPADDIKRTAIPVLAMNGTLDYQVPAEGNLSLIGKLLEGKNKHNKCVLLPGLNHLFQHATTGTGDEYYKIEETMAPEAMQTIAEWIGK